MHGETHDKSLLVDFRMAEALHANFYHNFMNKEGFEVHRQAVLELIRRLLRKLSRDYSTALRHEGLRPLKRRGLLSCISS